MVDIPSGVLTVVMAVLGAIGTAIGVAVSYVFKGKDSQITRLEAEVAAGRSKIDELQNKAQAALEARLDAELKRTDTDQRTAEALAALVKATVKT